MSPQRNTAPAPAPRRYIARVVTALGSAVAAGAAFLLTACADGAPTPTAPAAGPRLALTAEQTLLATELAEKQRVALAQEASQATYDSLQVEWARLNNQYPNGNPELLYCDPLQYAAQVQIVGPEGGDVSFGPHKLSIPKGALAARTVITAEAPTSMAVEARFSPHGLTFLKAPKLTLSYKHCNRPTTFSESVVYVNRQHQILERPLSTDRTLDALVDAWIRHFSIYAVAE